MHHVTLVGGGCVFFFFFSFLFFLFSVFFFNDTATTEIYTLSLHDALPIYPDWHHQGAVTAIELEDVKDNDFKKLTKLVDEIADSPLMFVGDIQIGRAHV